VYRMSYVKECTEVQRQQLTFNALKRQRTIHCSTFSCNSMYQ